MDQRTSIPWTRHLLFWSLAALGLAVDLGTKQWMFSHPVLLTGDVLWIWPNHAGFQLSLNEGALFGMGQGRVWIFAVCSIAAAVAIPAWLFVLGGAGDRALTIVLGCVLGGVLGNLYDRVGMPGLDWGIMNPARQGEAVYAVRDFLLLAWKWSPQWQERVVWPNFNVADSLLVCGAAALMFLSMRKPPQERTEIAMPAGPSPGNVQKATK